METIVKLPTFKNPMIVRIINGVYYLGTYVNGEFIGRRSTSLQAAYKGPDY